MRASISNKLMLLSIDHPSSGLRLVEDKRGSQFILRSSCLSPVHVVTGPEGGQEH